MKILSCGAGMQSTALALISCAQVHSEVRYPQVPRYDAIIYCDLGIEPASNEPAGRRASHSTSCKAIYIRTI